MFIGPVLCEMGCGYSKSGHIMLTQTAHETPEANRFSGVSSAIQRLKFRTAQIKFAANKNMLLSSWLNKLPDAPTGSAQSVGRLLTGAGLGGLGTRWAIS